MLGSFYIKKSFYSLKWQDHNIHWYHVTNRDGFQGPELNEYQFLVIIKIWMSSQTIGAAISIYVKLIYSNILWQFFPNS